MGRRIGLLGGTFNPIHFGHLNLALEIFEKRELEELWLIPTHLSPFRRQEILVDPHHRLKMTQLATNDIKNFKVLDVELMREAPSYTIDTLQILKKQFPTDSFFLLLGGDAIDRFPEWKEPEKILELATPLVGYRWGSFVPESLIGLNLSPKAKEKICQGVVETTLFDLSATTIRQRLAKGLYCGHLLPPKVLDYIYENQLYFPFKT